MFPLIFMWIAFSSGFDQLNYAIDMFEYVEFFFFVTFIPKGGETGLVDFDLIICLYFVTVHSLVTVMACFMGM